MTRCSRCVRWKQTYFGRPVVRADETDVPGEENGMERTEVERRNRIGDCGCSFAAICINFEDCSYPKGYDAHRLEAFPAWQRYVWVLKSDWQGRNSKEPGLHLLPDREPHRQNLLLFFAEVGEIWPVLLFLLLSPNPHSECTSQSMSDS